MNLTLTLTPQLYHYMIDHSLRESQTLAELRNETYKLSDFRMQISPDQGQFMGFLMELIGAKKTLDIGTFTGYSALAVALALPQDGKVMAFDLSDEWTTIAKKYWQKAGVANKIELKLGPASESLNELIQRGENNTYDFAFIDADKANYDTYYEQALQLVRQGGIIAIDNVLWSGKVADPAENDESTCCIRSLNEKLLKDNRVTISMLAVGDGLTLARKR
jgi:predicted O-methyltransferase YrrM